MGEVWSRDAGDPFRFVQAVFETSLKHPNIPERPSTDSLFLSLQGGQFTITKADFLSAVRKQRGGKKKTTQTSPWTLKINFVPLLWPQ